MSGMRLLSKSVETGLDGVVYAGCVGTLSIGLRSSKKLKLAGHVIRCSFTRQVLWHHPKNSLAELVLVARRRSDQFKRGINLALRSCSPETYVVPRIVPVWQDGTIIGVPVWSYTQQRINGRFRRVPELQRHDESRPDGPIEFIIDMAYDERKRRAHRHHY
jgi:hypothetical protein